MTTTAQQVGQGTAPLDGRTPVRFPVESSKIFILPVLLTAFSGPEFHSEMSNKEFPGGLIATGA